MIRGINNIGIESGNNCAFATPKDTWSNAEKERKEAFKTADAKITTKLPLLDKLFDLIDSFVQHVQAKKSKGKPGCILQSGPKIPPKILSPLPQDYIRDEDLPESWDWRNVNGTNYLSWTVNQHIPTYCGSCWAQGTLSALADRFIIQDPKKYANLALSPQALMNCYGPGTCHGGTPGAVYPYVHRWGVSNQR